MLHSTGLLVAHLPFDHACSAPQKIALVTSYICGLPQQRRASVCGSAAGRCAPAAFR
ncbi:MAG: hypothetical protein ABSH15_06035 [Verrucomicrobiota bacterium]